MSVAIVLGLLLLLAIGCACIAGAATLGRRQDKLSQRRLGLIVPASAAADEEARDTLAARAGRLIRRTLGAGVRQDWPSRMSTARLAAWSAAAVSVAMMLGTVLHAPWFLTLATVLAAPFVPAQLLLRAEQARQEARFTDLFPDVIDMMVRMLRAGLPMTAALRVVGTEAASPAKEVFTSIGDQIAIGATFEQALLTAAQRIRQQDFRFLTVAATLQQSTGGNLASTLEILADIIRKRRAARLKAKAVTAEVRMSANVLAAIPFVIVIGLLVIAPAYLAPLIVDPRGHVIVALAVGSLLSGVLVMRGMMRRVTRT